MSGIGGILGSMIGGVITQYWHPRYAFLTYSFFGLIVAFNGCFLTKECEQGIEENQGQQSQSDQNQSLSSLDQSIANQQRQNQDP